jgi:hypothetical protein
MEKCNKNYQQHEHNVLKKLRTETQKWHTVLHLILHQVPLKSGCAEVHLVEAPHYELEGREFDS